MIVVGLVLTGIAAAIHVFIFYLESLAWTSERARGVFGTTAPQRVLAELTELAESHGVDRITDLVGVAHDRMVVP